MTQELMIDAIRSQGGLIEDGEAVGDDFDIHLGRLSARVLNQFHYMWLDQKLYAQSNQEHGIFLLHEQPKKAFRL